MIVKKVAVIIPIYKTELQENEKKSLLQCFNVLSAHPIIFFCSPLLDCQYYEQICLESNVSFEKRTFNEKYFRSKKGYNELCLRKKFYKAFSDYEFILIYQLDAWVFFDQLDYWCDLGYDYIGAPFPIDIKAKDEDVVFMMSGNGGFSLRKIKSICNVFDNKYYRIKKWSQIINNYRCKINRNPLWLLYCILIWCGHHNSIKHLMKNTWEDHFFFDVARLTSFITMPNPEIALQFSFEYRPSIAFLKNDSNLPMGCHAWEWIEYDLFWKNYIK